MKNKDVKTPMGTVILMIVLILMISAFWMNAYFVMLSRGVTQ
jgi:hypothetical protein